MSGQRAYTYAWLVTCGSAMDVGITKPRSREGKRSQEGQVIFEGAMPKKQNTETEYRYDLECFVIRYISRRWALISTA